MKTIPAEACERLDALRQQASDAADAAANAPNRLAEIAERRRVLVDNAVHNTSLAAVAAEDERLVGEGLALRAVIEEAEAAAELYRRCEAWARNPSPIAYTATKAAKVKEPAGGWHDGIERVRAEIARLQSEARQTRDAPPSRDEAIEILKQRIQAMAVAPLVHADGRIEPQTRDPLATIAWLQPQTLLQRLTVQLPAGGGLPREARKARLAELGAQLDAAERHEEALVRAAEAAGELIARRGDARVDVVLGIMPDEGEAAAAA